MFHFVGINLHFTVDAVVKNLQGMTFNSRSQATGERPFSYFTEEEAKTNSVLVKAATANKPQRQARLASRLGVYH